MVRLSGIFSHLNQVRVAVIGDYMYDTYTVGKIHRISFEAPVPVLHVQHEEGRPGGAGNVVLNLISLGAEVLAIGRVGLDRAGRSITQTFKDEGVNIEMLFVQDGFQTPVKNRFIADGQQLLRVDFENIFFLSREVEKKAIDALSSIIGFVDIIAISDYGKGFISSFLLKAIIGLANSRGVFVIVDPKGEDFTKYQGATVLKPNLKEAYAAAKLSQDSSLEAVAQVLFEKTFVNTLLITRSESGISVFTQKGGQFHFPVRAREIKDVTGAGDTVLAMISIALANGLDIKEGAQLANIAAGIAIERVGCARVNLSDLASRLLEFDVDNKLFDEGHLFTLSQALQGKKCSVLVLYLEQEMTTALFQNIQKISSRQLEEKLIIYIDDMTPNQLFVNLLASLREVDFIVLRCKSFKELCDILHPDQIFFIENNKLAEKSKSELIPK